MKLFKVGDKVRIKNSDIIIPLRILGKKAVVVDVAGVDNMYGTYAYKVAFDSNIPSIWFYESNLEYGVIFQDGDYELV